MGDTTYNFGGNNNKYSGAFGPNACQDNSSNIDFEKFNKDIQEAIKEMNAQQTAIIVREIMTWITTATVELNDEMNGKLEEIKKTDDVQMKLKLSIPFIKLLGIDFVTEFNVKSWAKKMYEKHKLKLFKLMEAL